MSVNHDHLSTLINLCLVPQSFANIHDYNTRNASALPVVRARTSLYYNSFIPSSIRLWNLQPDNIRLSPSIQALKYSLKSNISSKPFYYHTGSRLGQILHSILRMQCSSLNQHLYRKNIVDSPNCICGLTESTTHYLFHCLRYTAQRQMHIPIDLTTEILLFAPNQNVELFLAVQFFLSVVSDSLLKVFCLFSLFHRFFFSLLCTSLSQLSSSIYLKNFTFISIQNNIVLYNLKFDII